MHECGTCQEELPDVGYHCQYCGMMTCRDHRAPDDHECTADARAVPDYRILDPGSMGTEPAEESTTELGIVETIVFGLRLMMGALGLVLVLFLLLAVLSSPSRTTSGSSASGPAGDFLLVGGGVVGLVVGGLLLAVVGYLVVFRGANRSASGESGVRNRATATLSSLWYGVRTSLGGGGPAGGGMVTVSGTIATPDEPFRSPLEDEEAVLWVATVDGFDDRTDAQFGTVGVPERPDLVSVVEVEPFVVETDDREVVVDPRPWDPGSDQSPHAGVPPSASPETTVDHSKRVDRTVALEHLEGPLRDRVLAALKRETGGVPGEVYLRITVDRLEPGERVEVLGWSVGDRDHPEPDVVNVAEARHPFRIRIE